MPEQNCFVEFLLEPKNYPFPVDGIEHFETHISHVFLAGDFAFKLKKAIQLPFLDFRRVEDRKFYLEEELRLNRRYAEPLYLEVGSLSLHGGEVSWGGEGGVLEYLLKMRRFKTADLFSSLLKSGELTREHLIELTCKVARFHKEASLEPEFFSGEAVRTLVFDCFEAIDEEYRPKKEFEDRVSVVLKQLSPMMQSRQKTHVRYLHGDLHLKNICLFKGEAYPFDGIEFDKKYSCIDTFADIAFLLMDLWYEERGDYAWVVLNTYLEQSFDYEGVALLRLFLTYRFLVRAKVAYLRYSQLRKESDLQSARNHLTFSQSVMSESSPLLFIVGGFSGSGKTYLSKILAEQKGLIHLRTDVFRKHLAGVALGEKLPEEKYSKEFTKTVYESVYAEARRLLSLGFGVVIDGVHGSDRTQRLAHNLVAQFPRAAYLLWCEAPKNTVAERLQQRSGDASDADLSIYEKQVMSGWEVSSSSWTKIATNVSRGALELILDELADPHQLRTARCSSSGR